MTMRSFFGGTFIIAGCTATVLFAAAMMLSMQMQTGQGLIAGLLGLAGGVGSLIFGAFVLLFQR